MDVLQSIGIDLVTLVGLVAYIVRMEMKVKELLKRREEDIHALEKVIEKNEDTMFKKFSNVHSRMDRNETESKAEFEKFNVSVNDIKIGMAAMDSKLTMILENLKK